MDLIHLQTCRRDSFPPIWWWRVWKRAQTDAHHDVINRSFRQSAAAEESLHFGIDYWKSHKEMWVCWGLTIGFSILGWFNLLMERCFANAQHDVNCLVLGCPIVGWINMLWRDPSLRDDVVKMGMENNILCFSSMSFRQSAASEESLHFWKDTSIGHKEFTELPIEYISWVTDSSLTLNMT